VVEIPNPEEYNSDAVQAGKPMTAKGGTRRRKIIFPPSHPTPEVLNLSSPRLTRSPIFKFGDLILYFPLP